MEVTQGFLELFLTWNLLGEIELTADTLIRLEQSHRVTALGQGGRCGKTRRARPYNSDFFGPTSWRDDQLGLMTGTRVDET